MSTLGPAGRAAEFVRRRRRVATFALVSGLGLVLDYAIYTALCESGVRPGFANLASAGAGVTFVFAVSARRIFRTDHEFLLAPFALYIVYQVVAVSLASLAVDTATSALDGLYLAGKTLVLPFSFTANYLFMSWLLASRSLVPEGAR